MTTTRSKICCNTWQTMRTTWWELVLRMWRARPTSPFASTAAATGFGSPKRDTSTVLSAMSKSARWRRDPSLEAYATFARQAKQEYRGKTTKSTTRMISHHGCLQCMSRLHGPSLPHWIKYLLFLGRRRASTLTIYSMPTTLALVRHSWHLAWHWPAKGAWVAGSMSG